MYICIHIHIYIHIYIYINAEAKVIPLSPLFIDSSLRTSARSRTRSERSCGRRAKRARRLSHVRPVDEIARETVGTSLGKLEKCGIFMVIKLYKMDFMDISWEYGDLTKKNVGFMDI